VYDEIGRGYSSTRRPDPRIARAIRDAVGEASIVVNVGAGAGSYEPLDLRVVAVEPSAEMIRQRLRGAAPAVRATAEALPFRDAAFDAALAVLTVHHWSDRGAGLRELARVARHRVVILTWDPGAGESFWLTTEYFPAILDLDVPRFPAIQEIAAVLGDVEARALPVPGECEDGFLGAFWRRPEAYLDPFVRGAMSGFAQLPPEVVDAGVARLAGDLRSGRWNERFGRLRSEPSADLGYRLIVARRA
jgi:SAM-dependent methyltransferase